MWPSQIAAKKRPPRPPARPASRTAVAGRTGRGVARRVAVGAGGRVRWEAVGAHGDRDPASAPRLPSHRCTNDLFLGSQRQSQMLTTGGESIPLTT
jgi:hypothetical protein